jgi:dTDP-4-dehydrorhamnose reductase
MKRVLIVGGTGQVGSQLVHLAAVREMTVCATSRQRTQMSLLNLDLRNQADIAAVLADLEPDVVFLPAALTNMEYAETHVEECWATNVAGPAALARTIARQHGKLVFFSTDHVFGEATRPLSETSRVAPSSIYARSKAAAEAVIRDVLPTRHLILRTSWVFGPDEQRKNFVCRAVDTLRRGERLRVPSDQFGQPTFSEDLAQAALDLWDQGVCGTYHLVGPDRWTRAQFAVQIADIFGLDVDLIDAVPTDQLGQRAPRPLQVWLARNKVSVTLGRDGIRSTAAALRCLAARECAELSYTSQ